MTAQIKKYRIQAFQDIENGKPVKRYNVLSKNGKQVAKCNTIGFAQRCATALEQLDNHNHLRLVGGMSV